jgi:hypothetical protein
LLPFFRCHFSSLAPRIFLSVQDALDGET